MSDTKCISRDGCGNMTENEKRLLRCSFTGHRPEKIIGSEAAVKEALGQAIDAALCAGKRIFISGMARGVDIWAAELVLERKRQNSDLHLICALPHPDFEKRWSLHWQRRYCAVLRQADLIRKISTSFSMASYQKRNVWMVDHSSLVIAVFNGEAGGTKKTIDYAMEQGIEVNLIDMRGSTRE